MAGVQSNNEKVEFSAKVPRDKYERFRELFPGYGATTYFINAALDNLLEQMESDPTAQARVQTAIDNMVRDNREAAAVS